MSEVNAQVPASSQATEASSLPQALNAVNPATEADELQQLQRCLVALHPVEGIGHCDRDKFNGSEAQLRKLWGVAD